MKKSIVLIILLSLILSVSAFGADRVDMIVLLDNSVSVLPYYEQIQKSLLGRIISEHLKPGDTFSLITFADRPEVEISREIKNTGDIDEILAYSSILQPMGNYTDLILALRFLYKYTLDLPLSNRKKIVILTDGIHDPPEGSPYIYSSSEEVREEVKKAGDEIHREGWDVSIVEIEDAADGTANTADGTANTADGTANTADGTVNAADGTSPDRLDVIDEVAESIGSEPNVFSRDEEDMAGIALGIPVVSIPDHLGDTTGVLELPLSVKNRSNEILLFSISAVIAEGADILKEKASVKLDSGSSGTLNIELLLPDTESGEQVLEINLKLVGGLKSVPEVLILHYNSVQRNSFNRGMDFLTDWRVIALIIAIIVAVLIIIIIKRASASSSSYTPVGRGVRDKEEDKKLLAGMDSSEPDSETNAASTGVNVSASVSDTADEELVLTAGPAGAREAVDYQKNRPIKMIAYGQNSKLGIANIQWLGVNRKRSIGSAPSSTYRIFFIKVPSLLARIECTGSDFIFYPENPEMFPELDAPMNDCLNKRIKVINEDNKMFYIEFIPWVSELERVNRLLSMTHYSGKPDMKF